VAAAAKWSSRDDVTIVHVFTADGTSREEREFHRLPERGGRLNAFIFRPRQRCQRAVVFDWRHNERTPAQVGGRMWVVTCYYQSDSSGSIMAHDAQLHRMIDAFPRRDVKFSPTLPSTVLTLC